MRRGVLFVLLIGLGTVLGGMVYAALRPVQTDEERKISWLAEQLKLTGDQQGKIRRLHEQYCPEIRRLGLACDGETPEAVRQCRNATRELVRAVSRELTAAQREQYLAIVECCLGEPTGAARRP